MGSGFAEISQCELMCHAGASARRSKLSTKADSPTQAARNSGLVSAPNKTAAQQPSACLLALDTIKDALMFPKQAALHDKPPIATEDTACHSIAAAPSHDATAPAKSDSTVAATACFDACHQTVAPTEADPPTSSVDAAASAKPDCTAITPADTQDLVPAKTASAKAGCPATPLDTEMHETTPTAFVSAASPGACCEAESQEPVPAAIALNAASPIVTMAKSTPPAAPLALPELECQETAPVEPGSATSGLNCTSSPQPEPAAVPAYIEADYPASVLTAVLPTISSPQARALACVQADLQELVPSTAVSADHSELGDATTPAKQALSVPDPDCHEVQQLAAALEIAAWPQLMPDGIAPPESTPTAASPACHDVLVLMADCGPSACKLRAHAVDPPQPGTAVTDAVASDAAAQVNLTDTGLRIESTALLRLELQKFSAASGAVSRPSTTNCNAATSAENRAHVAACTAEADTVSLHPMSRSLPSFATSKTEVGDQDSPAAALSSALRLHYATAQESHLPPQPLPPKTSCSQQHLSAAQSVSRPGAKSDQPGCSAAAGAAASSTPFLTSSAQETQTANVEAVLTQPAGDNLTHTFRPSAAHVWSRTALAGVFTKQPASPDAASKHYIASADDASHAASAPVSVKSPAALTDPAPGDCQVNTGVAASDDCVPTTADVALVDCQADKADAAPADCRAATADAAPAVHQTAPVGANLAKSPIAQLQGSRGDCQATPADVEPVAAAAPSSAAKVAEPVCSNATSLFCVDAEAAASLHPLLQIIAASARTKSASAALAVTHLPSEGSLPSIAVAAQQASNLTEATVHAAEQGRKE